MLRLLTYLAPSIPLGLYEAIGDYLAATLDREVVVASETRWSGPGPGSENAFASGQADIGFVCAPSYVWMQQADAPVVQLAGVAPVHDDARNEGKPVYFSEVVVPRASAARTLADLEGKRFAYNDPSSLSGYHAMLQRLAQEGRDAGFFGHVVASGSHLRSLDLLHDGEVDVAAIDANALAWLAASGAAPDVKVIESLGPHPVQPVVVRSALDPELKTAVREALLRMHTASGGQPLLRYGVQRFAAVSDADYLPLAGR